MFIAFEGPDDVGKSTSAKRLDAAGQPDYNATKAMHAANVAERCQDETLPHTYDRIDWFSHMVYRLALPDREWNDDRPRTVFAMPDTHLVVRVHAPELADFTADEVVDTPIAKVNPMYYYFADYFLRLNKAQQHALFKSVTIIEVQLDRAAGTFAQRIIAFDSSAFPFGTVAERLVQNDDDLLEFLRYVDQHTG